jgi:hypothetical protein
MTPFTITLGIAFLLLIAFCKVFYDNIRLRNELLDLMEEMQTMTHEDWRIDGADEKDLFI